MRLCAQLSALSARVDRVLQSAEASTSGGNSFVVLEKEDWPKQVDADDYLRDLQAREGTQMFRIGMSGGDSDLFYGTKIPYLWLHPDGGRRLVTLNTSSLSRMYMVFGRGVDCLLIMKGLPSSIVLKAELPASQPQVGTRTTSVSSERTVQCAVRPPPKSWASWITIWIHPRAVCRRLTVRVPGRRGVVLGVGARAGMSQYAFETWSLVIKEQEVLMKFISTAGGLSLSIHIACVIQVTRALVGL
jgi:hypothetical protein